ncbi:uncharacterized protein F4822DRAFT_443108 [Hypoxylon trugodes]|uniref:uncharacterized protein n=1 Tax=Hypoxylon trugodes TaxID=326681 RepID=UPI00219E9349|nr:uncharacterized protein F4822DRAFT_443108 [Hypoxylon trugodes]KAI1390105.1 hypothetical protein F4822DRAFT_443108 [Hypoxylon trugodes]
MFSLPVFPREGWRRTGAINVTLAYIYGLILLICFIVSMSRPDSYFDKATIIFEGDCTRSKTINLVLHLVLNILSTAILASSNFFMQVLSSPSRQEIDKAHLWLRSVDIGTPSLSNWRRVSPFKFAGCLVLFISSVPIHLFFNSTIYETIWEESHWHLVITTKAFTQNATFYPPGASLTPAGYLNPIDIGSDYLPGYGEYVPLEDYWNTSSEVIYNITSIANESPTWTQLDVVECKSEYEGCNQRKNYGDVVIIVEGSPSNPAGWTRNQVYHPNSSSNLSSQWDRHIPPESINSLYGSECGNTCFSVLGIQLREIFFPPELSQTNWTLNLIPSILNITTEGRSLGYNDEFSRSLIVRSCLAKRFSEECKVGLSNSLLLIVIICVVIKAITCNLTIWKFPVASLVTLGDAIQSFVTIPDPTTKGLGSLDIDDSQRFQRTMQFGRRIKWTPHDDPELTPNIRPRKWERKTYRLMSAVARTAWVRAYAPFLTAMALLSAALSCAAISSQGNFSIATFNRVETNVTNMGGSNLGYIGALLFANTPQLLLSFCYFNYNSLVTRFCIEREWNSLGLSYKPLRVSYPIGEQISSYRLELPYKYSIPLTGISIILHWLLSNAVYLFVFDGGYIGWNSGLANLNDQFRVSNESLISLGYSPSALLIFSILCFIALCLPILFGFYKLKGDIVAGGSNSLVLSACHVYRQPSDGVQANKRHARNIVSKYILTMAVKVLCLTPICRHFRSVLLRWGATPIPEELAKLVVIEDGVCVQHLGFGGQEYDIREPEDGHYYV